MITHSCLVIGFLAALAGACDDGWLSHGSMCYLFSHDTEDWSDSHYLCQLFGGQLVEIEDAAKNNFLQTQIQLYKKDFFIALTDIVEEGTWIWTTSKGELVPGSGFSNWAVHEPSNSNSDENCATIRTTGQWNDVACSNFNHYICEKPRA